MDYAEWKEGTILYTIFLHEGCYAQFYMITRRTPKTIQLTRVREHSKNLNPREWEATPTDICHGPSFKRTLSKHGVLDEENYLFLKKWDGKPIHCTHNY